MFYKCSSAIFVDVIFNPFIQIINRCEQNKSYVNTITDSLAASLV